MAPSRLAVLGAVSGAAAVAGVAALLVAGDDGGRPAAGGRAGAARSAAPAAGPAFYAAPVGAGPAVVPGSGAMIRAAVLPFVGSANLAAGVEWGIPIVQAAPAEPVRTVTVDGVPPRRLRFRIPDAARPSSGSDAHLAVVDGDRELDLWRARRAPDGSWRAAAAVVSPVPGSGVAGPIAADAAGFVLSAGVVRADELRRGQIAHALVFTTPHVRRGHVPPAVHGDGLRGDADAMPMGTHIQLDPDLDVHDLPRTARVVARALQTYGAYLVDTGGSLAIRAEAGIGGDPALTAIPWARTRVLAP
jgi:hypothetical protein